MAASPAHVRYLIQSRSEGPELFWADILVARFRSARPVHDFPAHNRCYHLAGKLPAVERGVVGFGSGLCGVEGPALFGIEDGYVGVTAAEKGSASPKVDNARRTGGEELDDTAERHLLAGVKNGNG